MIRKAINIDEVSAGLEIQRTEGMRNVGPLSASAESLESGEIGKGRSPLASSARRYRLRAEPRRLGQKTSLRPWALALAAATGLGFATRALSADATLDLLAGLACPGFDLRVESTNVQVPREVYDKNGNLVRIFQGGKGASLTFTNLNTGALLSIKPNGSVSQTRVNPDGTQAVMSTGHNVIILFPSDVPAGPTTIQYVGRITYTVDLNGVFTVTNVQGKQVDFCAALSS